MSGVSKHGTVPRGVAVVVVGPVPPPVTGQAVVTERLIDELARSEVACTLVNTAVEWTASPLHRKARRAARLALHTVRVLRKARRASTTYISVDASPGTIYTVLFAVGARVAKTRVVLHHHSYSYIAKPTFSMRCLTWLAGKDALHLTQCAAMSAEFGAKYPRIAKLAELSNPFTVDPELVGTAAPAPDTEKLVLGHLSNLTAAKGVLTVIECFAELHGRGEPVELHLAGPIWDRAAARAIEDAQARFGPAFRYQGPVDATGKRAFFSAIDVFLFPSTYKNETEGIVVLESLATGVPVIAFGHCCIPANLAGGCGLVVPPGEDFTAAAVRQIRAWQRNRTALRAAAAAAVARFAQLRRQSKADLAALVASLIGEPQPSGRDLPAPYSAPSSQPCGHDGAADQERTADGYRPAGALSREPGVGQQSGHHGSGAPSSVGTASGAAQRSAASTRGVDLVAIGPRPPWITGQAIATDALLRHLERSGLRISAADTAPRNLRAGWARRLSRLPRYLRAAATVAVAPKPRWIYIVLDADVGLYANAVYAALARLRGARVIAHHHNSSYLARPATRMRLFCKTAGADAVHITLCAAMTQDLRRGYPDVRHTLELCNTYALPDTVTPKTAPPERFILGHLSNLCVEKGLLTAINCLRLLRRAGVDATLRLAGPAANREAAAIIAAAKAEFPTALVHDGPCYGAAKGAFYRAISVFLFPSEYRNESQPVVVLEALAAGTPVIAYGRCCVPGTIGATGGLAVPQTAAFEDQAVPRLLCWAHEPATLQRASLDARRRFEELCGESEVELAHLLRVLELRAEQALVG